MLALGHALPLTRLPYDNTPGGVTDVWMWEDGLGMQWEAGISVPLD